MRSLISGAPVAAVVATAQEPLIVAERRPLLTLPTPRAAAVAVCSLLAFGVMLGSTVSPVAQSAAETPIVVAVSTPPAAPPAPTAAAPADDSAPASNVVAAAPVTAAPQQVQTIYETTPTPAPQPTPTRPAPLPVPPLPPLPTVSHVFVVMLTGHGYEAAFGQNSAAPYLSKTLTKDGELIPNYYGIAHGPLANEIALISGQGPTKQTAANCPDYGDVTPGDPLGDQGQASGDGCVYPADVKTLADQLYGAGNTWKAYVEGAGTAGCDHTTTAYEPWRVPFLYFHSLTDNAALCNPNVADLSQLKTDLAQVGDTPGLSYIVPDNCHDGSDSPCAPDQPSGLAASDAWLQAVIPQIEASPGYKQGGLIAITFDSAPKDGPEADSTACCGQPDSYPNLPADDPSQQPAAPADTSTSAGPAASASQFGGSGTTPSSTGTSTTPTGTTTTPTDTTGTPAPPPTRPTGGGGKVGLLLISPYIKPNTVNATGYYNHFSLFASIEDLFSQGRVGYGNLPDLPVFDKTVYTAYNGGTSNGDSGDQTVTGSSARNRGTHRRR